MELQPLVSIGLPVYNGQNFINQAVDSVLNQSYQSYQNFELVISDNASTDKTPELCKAFANQDDRVVYHHFDQNYGASRNYNKTFELATVKYFKWLAHDDMIAPENLSTSVEVLESGQDIVLCGSAKTNLNANGEVIDEFDYSGLHLTSGSIRSRYRSLLKHFTSTFTDADLVLTGLMRTDILKQTILIANYTSADFTLLADLILKGKFVVVKKPLYKRRIHHGISTSVHNGDPEEASKMDSNKKIVHKSHAEIAKWYDPKGKVRRLPHLTWLGELKRSIKKNSFQKKERISLLMMSYKWFIKKVMKSIRNKLKKIT